MQVPAFCDTCGAAFPSGFVVNGSSSATFVNNKAGPCPSCGGWGHVPDGVFSFVDDTIRILSAPGRTRAELTRLASMARNAREGSVDSAELSQAIGEAVPGLAPLGRLLPQNREQLYAFLTLLLTAIMLLLAVKAATAPRVTVEQVFNQTLIESPAATAPHTHSQRKVGRNEPCPCGSGLKYKRCCGKGEQ